MEMTVKLNKEYSDKIANFVKRHSFSADDDEINAEFVRKLNFFLKTGVLNVEGLEILKRFGGCENNTLGFYVHEMLNDLRENILAPKYEPPTRNPELLARLEILKAKQANLEYEQMTKDVSLGNLKSNSRPKDENSSGLNFGQELQAMNKFLIVFVNTVLTVAGSFFFTYTALGYAIPNNGFVVQMISGCIVASIVFFADLYFILKSV